MTLPANIRVNVSAPFPARVTPADLVRINKANGIWTVGTTYASLGVIPGSVLNTNAWVAVWDSVGNVFYYTTLSALLNSAFLPPFRMITAAGPVTAAISDGDILINKAAPAATAVALLPAVNATRPITVKDYAGNAATFPITVSPTGAETIDGLATFVLGIDGASATFYPMPGIGYYVK